MPNPHSQLWRWEVAQMLGAGASDTAPANPAPNQLWWESDTGALFIWYVDPDSAQWVQIADGRPTLYDPFIFGTADMSLRSGAAGAVNVNSKADGTGTDVLTLSASGGLIFPATQLNNSNPNALDDYEEGTWTMTVTTGSGTLGGYTVQEAGYTKIGRMVHIYGRFTVTSLGTGSGYYNVAGLPFTCGASAAEMGGAGREAAVNGMGFIFHVRPGLSTAFLTQTDAAATPVGVNYQINFSGYYRT